MARRNPSKLEQLQQDNDELVQALQEIWDKATNADDAKLERGDIVERLSERLPSASKTESMSMEWKRPSQRGNNPARLRACMAQG